MPWELLSVLVIAVAVWILSSLFRGAEEERRSGQSRSDGDSAQRGRRRPANDLDRFLEEARRRRSGAERRAPPRPPERREVVVEAPRPATTPRRQPRTPSAPPVRQPPTVIVPEAVPVAIVMEKRPAAAQPVLEALPVVEVELPRPAPRPVPRPRSAAPASPALTTVADLLRSAKDLRRAVILNEIFNPPLSLRGTRPPRG